MKKTISIILSVIMLISVFAAVPLTADAVYIDYEIRKNDTFEYMYYKDEGYVCIYSYLGKDAEVVIPETIDGLPVTSTVPELFTDCDFVTKITLPDTMTYVGEDAFTDTAFYKNKKNWENGVLYIGSVLVAADENIEGEYKIKEGTTVIEHLAFVGCEKLTKITIPGTVKHIPEKTFCFCSSLKTAVLENGVEFIDETAFKNCAELSDIRLPKTINRIGFDAFIGTAFYNNDYNWDNGALYYDNILIAVDTECKGCFVIKEGTTVLADYAFMETNVEKIVLPDGIKRLPYAFINNCLWIKSIELNNDLEELDTYSVDMVDNVNIPQSVKKINYRAFFQSEITEITLPDNLEEIGVEAFLSCEKLKEVTIPASVKKIGHEAFGYSMTGMNNEGYITSKDGIIIKGYPNTAAEAYAELNDFEFVDLSKEPETEPVKPDEPEPVVTKKSNPLSVTAKTASVKAKKLRSKKQTLKPVTVKNAQGKVVYKIDKKGSTAKIYKLAKINSKGVITLSKWKKAKKGDYKLKISITAKGNGNYKPKTVNKVVKVKIK